MVKHTLCRFIIFATSIIASQSSFSQNWLPPDATWHTGIIESFFFINQGYIVSTMVGDSVILTKNTRVIQNVRYRSYIPMPDIDTMYMYEDSSRVYHYTNGQFYKLYDYNLVPGDTWQISVPFPSPFTGLSMTSPDTIVTIVVDSIGTRNINGVIRKTQYVHSNNNDWYFLNPIVEGIGSSGGFFPSIYDWQDFDLPFLRCYSDSSIYYQVYGAISCDTIISGIAEDESVEFKVFPNPIHDRLTIYHPRIPSSFLITILDSRGRECLNEILQPGKENTTLDVSQFAPGFYLCTITNDKLRYLYKLFKY